MIVSGNRPDGFIQAYDAETGKYAWTWSPIPKAGDPALASWGGAPPSGMPIWVSGSYDPEQHLIFYGTGQPEPQWVGKQRPGDDLYSDCIVALDVDTGKLKWYFQFTPHDTHDFDALEMPVLVDAVYQGQPRKLLLQANRNGYYYVLDRTTGKFLAGAPFVSRIDWATGLDANGKALLNPGHDPSVKGMSLVPRRQGQPTGRRPPTIPRPIISMRDRRKAAASTRWPVPRPAPAPAMPKTPMRPGRPMSSRWTPSPERRCGPIRRCVPTIMVPAWFPPPAALSSPRNSSAKSRRWMPKPASRCGISTPAI